MKQNDLLNILQGYLSAVLIHFYGMGLRLVVLMEINAVVNSIGLIPGGMFLTGKTGVGSN